MGHWYACEKIALLTFHAYFIHVQCTVHTHLQSKFNCSYWTHIHKWTFGHTQVHSQWGNVYHLAKQLTFVGGFMTQVYIRDSVYGVIQMPEHILPVVCVCVPQFPVMCARPAKKNVRLAKKNYWLHITCRKVIPTTTYTDCINGEWHWRNFGDKWRKAKNLAFAQIHVSSQWFIAFYIPMEKCVEGIRDFAMKQHNKKRTFIYYLAPD